MDFALLEIAGGGGIAHARQHMTMFQRNPLGRAGRPRGMHQHHDIMDRGARDQSIGQPRLGGKALAPFFADGVETDHALGLVAGQTAGIVIDDQVQRRIAFAHLGQLVDLFLILGDGETDRLALHLGRQLVGRGLGIGGRGDGPQRRHPQHPEIQVRTVVADDQHHVARLDALRLKPGGEFDHRVQVIRPAVFLPDAAVAFAHGHVTGMLGCVARQTGDDMVARLPVRVQRLRGGDIDGIMLHRVAFRYRPRPPAGWRWSRARGLARFPDRCSAPAPGRTAR